MMLLFTTPRSPFTYARRRRRKMMYIIAYALIYLVEFICRLELSVCTRRALRGRISHGLLFVNTAAAGLIFRFSAQGPLSSKIAPSPHFMTFRSNEYRFSEVFFSFRFFRFWSKISGLPSSHAAIRASAYIAFKGYACATSALMADDEGGHIMPRHDGHYHAMIHLISAPPSLGHRDDTQKACDKARKEEDTLNER